MNYSDLVEDFRKWFNSRFALPPMRTPLSDAEVVLLYVFASWLERHYAPPNHRLQRTGAPTRRSKSE